MSSGACTMGELSPHASKDKESKHRQATLTRDLHDASHLESESQKVQSHNLASCSLPVMSGTFVYIQGCKHCMYGARMPVEPSCAVEK